MENNYEKIPNRYYNTILDLINSCSKENTQLDDDGYHDYTEEQYIKIAIDFVNKYKDIPIFFIVPQLNTHGIILDYRTVDNDISVIIVINYNGLNMHIFENASLGYNGIFDESIFLNKLIV